MTEILQQEQSRIRPRFCSRNNSEYVRFQINFTSFTLLLFNLQIIFIRKTQNLRITGENGFEKEDSVIIGPFESAPSFYPNPSPPPTFKRVPRPLYLFHILPHLINNGLLSPNKNTSDFWVISNIKGERRDGGGG